MRATTFGPGEVVLPYARPGGRVSSGLDNEDADFAVEAVFHRGDSRRRDPDSTINAHVDLMDAGTDRHEQLPLVASAPNERQRRPIREVAYDLDRFDAADARRDALDGRAS